MIKASAIGGTGVHVFFFCSGFGLYLSYLRKPIGFVDFMQKRMLKIYVPYIIVIFISAFVNNPVPVSLLSGDRKPQIRFLGNHHSGKGILYH